MNRSWRLLAISFCFAALLPAMAFAAKPEALLKTIKSVGREGTGGVEAARAMRELTKTDATVLPLILRSFRGANPLAANYLRSVVETIADRQLKRGKPLPAADFEKFVLDKSQNPRARRLAYELLIRVDTSAPDRLIADMLDDPSPEFRRDAVARLIDQAKRLQDAGKAVAAFRRALSGATDDDQVKAIVKSLRAFGQKVDLQKHFGFLVDWKMIGPFDNRGKIGFAAVYPPEKKVDLKAEYDGQLGKVRWAQQSTEDEYGILDIAKKIKNYKGSVMYSTTQFVSEKERAVELRLGTSNAWKLWLNGKLLFGRDEYHRGMRIDQYRVKVVMKPGRNTILLKICQNEQTQKWAQRYQFQLRVCEASGLAVLAPGRDNTAQLDSNTPNTLTVRGVK